MTSMWSVSSILTRLVATWDRLVERVGCWLSSVDRFIARFGADRFYLILLAVAAASAAVWPSSTAFVLGPFSVLAVIVMITTNRLETLDRGLWPSELVMVLVAFAGTLLGALARGLIASGAS